MGRRGPQPRSDLMKIEPNIPAPSNLELQPPSYLDVRAQQEWNRVLSVFAQMAKQGQHVLTRVDLSLLAEYCALLSEFEQLSEQIEREGFVQKTKRGGDRVSGAFNARSKLLPMLIKIQTQLGFSPSSRANMQVIEEPEETDEEELISV